MKALTYHGAHNVSVDTMPDPGLEAARLDCFVPPVPGTQSQQGTL